MWWAVKDVDWQEVGSAFKEASYSTIPLYLLCLILFFWLKAVRWSWLLRPVKSISVKSVAGPMMVGFMGNNVLPAHLGELFRVILLGRQQNVPFASVFSSVAIERLLDVFAVLVLVGCGMLAVREVPPLLEQSFLVTGIAATIGVVLMVAGLIWLKQAIWLAQAVIARLPLPEKLRSQLSDLVEAAANGTIALKNGRLLFGLLLNSLVQWSLNCMMIYISLRSFGIQAPFSATLILLGVLVFAVTIPSTPGFFGAIQVAFVETLALFGVLESAAFAASIYYHLLQYVVVTAVGLICLWRSGASLTKLQSDAEQFEDDKPLDAQAGEDPTNEDAKLVIDA